MAPTTLNPQVILRVSLCPTYVQFIAPPPAMSVRLTWICLRACLKYSICREQKFCFCPTHPTSHRLSLMSISDPSRAQVRQEQ